MKGSEVEKRPWWRQGGLWLLLGLTLLLLAYFRQTLLAHTGGVLGVPLDDAWIHFQFARNIAQGHGFSFNPGEPTPGSTAPLWTLFLAAIGLFTEDFLPAALLLSASFLLLAVALTYGLTFSLTHQKWVAFLAGLGVAMTGRLLWAGLAGMETTAFAAFTLMAVWLYTRQGLRPLPVLLFALASQIRPEGHALFALALFDALIINHYPLTINHLRQQFRPLVTALLIYALIAAPYTLFSLSTTGRPLPNTFYAKVSSEHLFSLRTLRETAVLHWQDNPVSVLLLLGLLPAWRRSRLVVLWLVGLFLLMPVIVDSVWHHGRYTMPLVPFQMVVAALGAGWLVLVISNRLSVISSRLSVRGQLFTVYCLLFTVFLVGGLWRLPHWAEMLGTNANEILEIDVALGEWLAENTPPNALLAVDDIGAITFLSQRRIVDLNGLVSPEIWPAVRQPVGLPRNQVATRILSQSRPDYLVGFPLWHWELSTSTAVAQPIYTVETETQTIIFQPLAQVLRMTWPYVTKADPETAVDAVLADSIRLLGFDLAVGSELDLTLYWQSLAGVDADYDVFVHLVDGQGQIVAQADRQPVQALAPTGLWQPGDVVRDPYQVPLPPDLPPDQYILQVGMFLRQTGERPATTGADALPENAIRLTTLTLNQDP